MKNAPKIISYGRQSIDQTDIDEVLKLEEKHFGALSGQGLVQTALKKYQKAIASYLEAHKIYPAMKTPLIMIEKLQLMIKKQTIWEILMFIFQLEVLTHI